VLPLAVYLLTFVLAFWRGLPLRIDHCGVALAALVLLAAAGAWRTCAPLWLALAT